MFVLVSGQFISFLFNFLFRTGLFPGLLLISIAATCNALEYSTTYYPLEREISDQETRLIIAFLSSLAGEHIELKRP